MWQADPPSLGVGCLSHASWFFGSDGTTHVCGDNEFGQLCAQPHKVLAPTPFPSREKILSFGSGYKHAGIVTASGQLGMFGDNSKLQLGRGGLERSSVPLPVQCPEQAAHWTAVRCGFDHTLALTSNGRVYGFGSNSSCQLGVTSTIDTQFVYLVKSLVDNVVSGIHVGQNHSVVVTSENEIYVFGNNECGQLGLGHKDNVGVPERLVIRNEYSSQEKIVFVSCGAMHSSFLAESRVLYVYGYLNREMDFGEFPLKLDLNWYSPCKSIASGSSHILMLLNNNEVVGVGVNSHGQLGMSESSTRYLTRINLPTLDSDIKEIACGFQHSFLLTGSGEVYGIGRNERGQLGIGNTEHKAIWTKVALSIEVNHLNSDSLDKNFQPQEAMEEHFESDSLVLPQKKVVDVANESTEMLLERIRRLEETQREQQKIITNQQKIIDQLYAHCFGSVSGTPWGDN